MANSYVIHTGDGSTTQYAVPFPYISRSHVKCSINGAQQSFTWVNSGTIQLTTTPANNAPVKVYRETSPATRVVDYATGTLTEEDLDNDSRQAFYRLQEIEDSIAEQIDSAASGIVTVERETQTATAGQTVFTLTTITYTPAISSLRVFVNGLYQTPSVDYAETSSTVVTFTSGLVEGDLVTFLVNEEQAINSVDAAGVSYTPTFGNSTNLSAYLNLKVLGLKKNFGAVMNGTSDDIAALNTALQTTGKIIEIEQGILRFNSNPVAPTCAQIIGWGEGTSVLKAGSAVTKGLSIGATNYPRVLRGFTLDGFYTSGATGLFLGDTGSCGLSVENVRVSNFLGSNGVGLRLGDVLKTNISHVTVESCNVGLMSLGVDTLFPTTVLLLGCVFSDNAAQGAYIKSGYNLKFVVCDFESSGQEGALILGNGLTATEIDFDDCWFEANQGNDNTKYHFVAGDGTAAGGALIRPILRNCRFATDTNQAKCIRMNGAAVNGFVIENPQPTAEIANTISIENGASGSIPVWAYNRDFANMVNDPLNKIIHPGHGWRSYTPTVTSSVGNATATFASGPTITRARFLREGRKMTVNFQITGTLNAVTPTWVAISVPTGITVAADTPKSTNIEIGGVYQTGLLAAEEPDNLIYIRKADGSSFTSGATVTLRGEISFEV